MKHKRNPRYMRNILTGVPALLTRALAYCAALLFGIHPLIAAANTYDAAVETHESTVRRTNDSAVTARHLLWYATSATAVDLASATTPALGTIDNTETSTGVAQTVLLLGKGSTKKVVASEAISAGAKVFQAASGKVAAGGTLFIGYALTAAAADNDIIELDDTAPEQVTLGLAVAATRTILASENGATFFFGHGTEFAMTLPAPFLGARYRFVCTAAPTGASYTIVTASSANIIKGSFASAADAGGSMDSETSGGDTISFVDGQAVAGDWVELLSDGTNWFATGIAADEDALTITTAS